MKFLKTPALLAAFLLTAALGFAQSADQIIQESKAKFNSLTDLTATVAYTMANPNLASPQVKSGTLWMKKAKYKVVFTSEEMYCNGIFVWVYQKSKKTTDKLDFDPEESLSPDRVFKIYQEESKVRYDALEGNRHKITVFSSKENSDIIKTVVWINKTTKIIEKASLYARSGSTYTYELSAIQTNTQIGDAIFNYDEAAAKRAGIYINDLTGE
jgi:outer membrane lipoprotein carrier protein